MILAPRSSNSQIFYRKIRRGRRLSSEFWSGEGHWFVLPALYVSEWSQRPPNRTAATAVCCGTSLSSSSQVVGVFRAVGHRCLAPFWSGRAWGQPCFRCFGSWLKLTVGQFSKFSIDFNYFSVFKKIDLLENVYLPVTWLWKNETKKKLFFWE